jgi:hypothetical protein
MSRAGPLAAGSILVLLLTATGPATADQKQTAPPPSAATAVADDQVCLQQIRIAERAHRIPSGLLAAIGLTESGRAIGRGRRAVWPWTVNAAGEGRYFDSKADAVAFVEGKLADGVQSIDVGCMQINLKHHPDAFASLEDAFDPATNVRYGARFLAALHGELKGWIPAARRYHSATPEKGEAYGARVLANWTGPAKERELAAQQATPTEIQVATAAGFLRAAPVQATAGSGQNLFSQFYTPAALTYTQPLSPPTAAAQPQPGSGQTPTAGQPAQLVSAQKVFQRKVAPGQTGLTLQDYRSN